MNFERSLCVLVLLVGLTGSGTESQVQLNFPILNSVRNIVQRLTNTTIGVVRGGINAMGGTFLRIINRVGQATDKVADLLEEVRKYMPTGIPELGIPRLEPLTVDKLEFDIHHEIANIKGIIENIEIRQLSKFKLENIEINLPKIALNITFPFVEINGLYNIDGVFGDLFKLFGDGPFWLKAQGLSIGTEIVLESNLNNGFHVQDMDIELRLNGMENWFENLMGDDELCEIFNKAISKLAPEAVDILWPDLKGPIQEQVVTIINEILQDSFLNNTLGRLLNIFNFNTG